VVVVWLLERLVGSPARYFLLLGRKHLHVCMQAWLRVCLGDSRDKEQSMFENVKVGDVVATITLTGLTRLVRIKRFTKKMVYVNSSVYTGVLDKYSREDGSRIGKTLFGGTSLTTVDDPRVVRRLANTFYNDSLVSILGSYGNGMDKDLDVEALVSRLEDIKSYLDDTSAVIRDASELVDRFI
jgi:hypothetical protein